MGRGMGPGVRLLGIQNALNDNKTEKTLSHPCRGPRAVPEQTSHSSTWKISWVRSCRRMFYCF